MQFEFQHIEKWLMKDGRYGNGVDVGCGTNRISDQIISIDQNPNWAYAHAQLVHDCKDLEIFADGALDFIFSSHCLEDFSDIPSVFVAWWKKLRVDGLMILLLPDMESGRYAKVGDPHGNPSHRTDVGKKYINDMLNKLAGEGKIKFEMIQEDTIPHEKSSTIDFVIRKK